jgi:hypothetical protein
MSKHKKVHQLGNPRNAQNTHSAELNAAELRERKRSGQSAAATNGSDSMLASAGCELKETSQNAANTVKREVKRLRPYLDQLVAAGSHLSIVKMKKRSPFVCPRTTSAHCRAKSIHMCG